MGEIAEDAKSIRPPRNSELMQSQKNTFRGMSAWSMGQGEDLTTTHEDRAKFQQQIAEDANSISPSQHRETMQSQRNTWQRLTIDHEESLATNRESLTELQDRITQGVGSSPRQ